ncbi:hypothetical protein PTKIN_Ptkin12aG0063100 [Pterospermum kingtungense]
MELKKTVEDQILASSLFLLNNPILSWIVVLVSLITSATFYIFGCLSIFLTSTVLIFSTILFIFCKRKPKLVEESVKGEIHKAEIEDILVSKQQHESAASEGEGGSYDQNIHDDYLVRSPDVLSENECVDQLSITEDSSEVDWPFRDNNMDQTPDYSDDGSISDEDSLIEISLPGGHYVSSAHKEEEPNNKYCMQQKLPADHFIMPESIFQQRSLMELLAEFNDINEEDNLIEIDISMGSIKCSRFEIEA